eukprot:1160847-Pelagomonas_calceolata.AAC.1
MHSNAGKGSKAAQAQSGQARVAHPKPNMATTQERKPSKAQIQKWRPSKRGQYAFLHSKAQM